MKAEDMELEFGKEYFVYHFDRPNKIRKAVFIGYDLHAHRDHEPTNFDWRCPFTGESFTGVGMISETHQGTIDAVLDYHIQNATLNTI